MGSLTSLELMILSLVNGGRGTPYSLRSAGLSVGSTLPALERLRTRKLLSRAGQGPRGRSDFALTATGVKTLRQELRGLSLRLARDNEPEEVLRLCAIAAASGRTKEAVKALGMFEAPFENPPPLPKTRELSSLYAWMRSRVQQQVKRAERDAIRRLADELKG